MQFNLRFNIYSNSLTQKDKKVKLRTRIFRFPDACVWSKHSAWTSTHHRAEARTHYPQRNGAYKAPSGRELSAKLTEGECVIIKFNLNSESRRLLPQLRGPPSSRRKAFALHFSTDSGFGLLPDCARTSTRYACPRRKRRESEKIVWLYC